MERFGRRLSGSGFTVGLMCEPERRNLVTVSWAGGAALRRLPALGDRETSRLRPGGTPSGQLASWNIEAARTAA
jgi:hypothetical protein